MEQICRTWAMRIAGAPAANRQIFGRLNMLTGQGHRSSPTRVGVGLRMKHCQKRLRLGRAKRRTHLRLLWKRGRRAEHCCRRHQVCHQAQVKTTMLYRTSLVGPKLQSRAWDQAQTACRHLRGEEPAWLRKSLPSLK